MGTKTVADINRAPDGIARAYFKGVPILEAVRPAAPLAGYTRTPKFLAGLLPHVRLTLKEIREHGYKFGRWARWTRVDAGRSTIGYTKLYYPPRKFRPRRFAVHREVVRSPLPRITESELLNLDLQVTAVVDSNNYATLIWQ